MAEGGKPAEPRPPSGPNAKRTTPNARRNRNGPRVTGREPRLPRGARRRRRRGRHRHARGTCDRAAAVGWAPPTILLMAHHGGTEATESLRPGSSCLSFLRKQESTDSPQGRRSCPCERSAPISDHRSTNHEPQTTALSPASTLPRERRLSPCRYLGDHLPFARPISMPPEKVPDTVRVSRPSLSVRGSPLVLSWDLLPFANCLQ